MPMSPATRATTPPTPTTPTRARVRDVPRCVRARAFVPPIVPNPNADDGGRAGGGRPAARDAARALAPLGWAIGAERGYDETPHAFKIFKVRDGMRALEAVRDRLYTEEERGCRIRRETQGLWYVCCDGARCRLNEGRHEIVVEVPLDGGSVKACLDKVMTIEEAIKEAGKRRT